MRQVQPESRLEATEGIILRSLAAEKVAALATERNDPVMGLFNGQL